MIKSKGVQGLCMPQITTGHGRLLILRMGSAQSDEEVACRGPVAFFGDLNQQKISTEV